MADAVQESLDREEEEEFEQSSTAAAVDADEGGEGPEASDSPDGGRKWWKWRPWRRGQRDEPISDGVRHDLDDTPEINEGFRGRSYLHYVLGGQGFKQFDYRHLNLNRGHVNSGPQGLTDNPAKRKGDLVVFPPGWLSGHVVFGLHSLGAGLAPIEFYGKRGSAWRGPPRFSEAEAHAAAELFRAHGKHQAVDIMADTPPKSKDRLWMAFMEQNIEDMLKNYDKARFIRVLNYEPADADIRIRKLLKKHLADRPDLQRAFKRGYNGMPMEIGPGSGVKGQGGMKADARQDKEDPDGPAAAANPNGPDGGAPNGNAPNTGGPGGSGNNNYDDEDCTPGTGSDASCTDGSSSPRQQGNGGQDCTGGRADAVCSNGTTGQGDDGYDDAEYEEVQDADFIEVSELPSGSKKEEGALAKVMGLVTAAAAATVALLGKGDRPPETPPKTTYEDPPPAMVEGKALPALPASTGDDGGGKIVPAGNGPQGPADGGPYLDSGDPPRVIMLGDGSKPLALGPMPSTPQLDSGDPPRGRMLGDGSTPAGQGELPAKEDVHVKGAFDASASGEVEPPKWISAETKALLAAEARAAEPESPRMAALKAFGRMPHANEIMSKLEASHHISDRQLESEFSMSAKDRATALQLLQDAGVIGPADAKSNVHKSVIVVSGEESVADAGASTKGNGGGRGANGGKGKPRIG